jgi:hypothetical protein
VKLALFTVKGTASLARVTLLTVTVYVWGSCGDVAIATVLPLTVGVPETVKPGTE